LEQKQRHHDVLHFSGYAEVRAPVQYDQYRGGKKVRLSGKRAAIARYYYGDFDTPDMPFRFTDTLYISTSLIRQYTNAIILTGISAEKACMLINASLSEAGIIDQIVPYISVKTWMRTFEMFNCGCAC
jgi:hypothetical protein